MLTLQATPSPAHLRALFDKVALQPLWISFGGRRCFFVPPNTTLLPHPTLRAPGGVVSKILACGQAGSGGMAG